MDSENGVALEKLEHGNGLIEKTPPVEGLALNLNKENKNVDNGVDVLQVNGGSEELLDVEGLNPSGVEVEAPVTVSESKRLTPSKKPGAGHGDGLKNTRTPKDQATRKGSTALPRNQRSSLSQSLSFPSGGILANGLKKSIDGKPVKIDARHSRANGKDTEAPVSNGSVTSRLNHNNRRASTGVSSRDARSNGVGVSARRTTLASVPSIRPSVSGKSGSMNATVNGPPSDVSLSHDQSLKPISRSLPIIDDEDARSTTSSTTPSGSQRNSGSGFAFRLDERAEKRKEFFTKLEEKIHAKEVERNNLQEKSKESQEAEIKQLRKSLAFKASPMPSFYKEPPPPKVELKKIPTTRAVSPKFGRHKTFIAVEDNTYEGGGSCWSPRPTVELSKLGKGGARANTNGNSVDTKKPIRKSLSKLPSQKLTTTKTEGKPLNSKPKITDAEHETQKALREEVESQNISMEISPESEAGIEVDYVKNIVEDDESILNLPDPEITCDEIAIKG